MNRKRRDAEEKSAVSIGVVETSFIDVDDDDVDVDDDDDDDVVVVVVVVVVGNEVSIFFEKSE